MRKARLTTLLSLTCLSGLGVAVPPAFAQDASPPSAEAATEAEIVVTGSRIRRTTLDSAVPIEVVTLQDLTRNSVSSPEQLIATLSSVGNGVDNLASQSDVAVTDEQRNVNGFSGANLRGQGSNATLVLLNGRRLAAHGLSGSAVDVNQIPLAAVARTEVLKDGASAIYGTDAIGGVINFILREDLQGLTATASTDITEQGGGNIYTASLSGGFGDLDTQNFNIMAAVGYRKNEYLAARHREFVDTHQPERGLAVDTRGTPFGTIFAQAGTIFTTANAPFIPGTTIRATGGINPLALPGQAGCASIPDMLPYDAALWVNPSAALACAYDTGRAATLAQPQETYTWVARGVTELQGHKLSLEYAGSNATAARRFSEIQLFPAATGAASFNFPRTAANAAVYDRIFNQLQAAFGTTAVPEANRGLPFAYRWRCMECGQREITTETDSGRLLANAVGPLPFLEEWRYDAGASWAFNESTSVTGGGYYYRSTDTALGIVGIRDALRTGLINPFLLPGQTQTPEALALLRSAEARGINIAAGRSELRQFDISFDGPLFTLPAGEVLAAVGADYREETYSFLGEARTGTIIFIEGAPIDTKPALAEVSREVTAFYAELLVPLHETLEVGLAVRTDEYSGFGRTTNPKITARFRPVDQIALRGSYSTGFRVPTFTDQFNPVSESQVFEPFADPQFCPGGIPNLSDPRCFDLSNTSLPQNAGFVLNAISGGKPDLEPEEAEQISFGVVFEPTRNLAFTVDYWEIERTNSIVSISRADLVNNFGLFADRFVRNAQGRIIAIDQRRVNAGGSITEGLDITGRGTMEWLGGDVTVGLDGTYLIDRREKVLPNAPFGPTQVGRWNVAGDLSLRWRHSLFVSWSSENWDVSLTQLFRTGYIDQVLPGVANGTVNPPQDQERTENYDVYNFALGYTGFENFRVNFGIRNVLNEDPPFARSYFSGTGGGANWEPRVADPRGRSFILSLAYDL